MEQISVISSPLPFCSQWKTDCFPEGWTIQQIVDSYELSRYGEAVGIVVFVHGQIVPPQYWPRIKPKAHTLINLNVVPSGGGGKKNPLSTILSIAVMIAAPYVGAALGTSLGLGVVGGGVLTGAQTALFNGIVSGAFSIVGRMLVDAIAPPPKPSNAGTSSSPAESPTQFIQGATNRLLPYGVTPWCLGTNRMFPPQAARAYTETQNNNQFVRQLFTWGWGSYIQLAEIKIGETPIANFSDIDMNHRLAGDLHVSTNLFSNSVSQTNESLLLREVDGYVVRNVAPASDEVIVDITFPQGLTIFNDQGQRGRRNVLLEVQYAPVATSDWSPGATAFSTVSGATMTFTPPLWNPRNDTIILNPSTGQLSIIRGFENWIENGVPKAGIIPAGSISIAKVIIDPVPGGITSVTDIRPSSAFGVTLQNSSSFIPTQLNSTQVSVSSGGLKVNSLNIFGSQTEALIRSHRIKFPTRGDYQIRVRRVTADTSDTKVLDKAYLTAIKSITYESPVRLQGITGSAVRIRATDQLNGSIEQLNAVVSNYIPDYDVGTDTWVQRETSNPASIYRHVLQAPANARALPDSKIIIEDLEAWHTYCEERGYTYNRVIDYETDIESVLRDVASYGSASPNTLDGKRTVVVDREKPDIVQIITPRNSWGYSSEILYPNLPHAFRVTFRNRDAGYLMDERMVYFDGYNADNATLIEELELVACDNAELAYKMARRIGATAILRPESHSFFMDFENLIATRGDRIKLFHDIPLAAIGYARIKELILDSSGDVAGFLMDDVVSIPMDDGDVYIRVRMEDGSFFYRQLIASAGSYTEFYLVTPEAVGSSPLVGDLAGFTFSGGEVDLIITKIEPSQDLTARITAVDYAPAIFDAETGSIPPFTTSLTVPLEFQRLIAPVFLEAQSDESAMLRNSDGSLITRAIITLENQNDGDIAVEVKIRRSGDTAFTVANILEATPERVVITGLDDGSRYDIHMRYRRMGTNVFSPALELNLFLFEGAIGVPSDVNNFRIAVTAETSFFEWDSVPDIDLSHYVIRYSRVFTGATWGTSQVIADNIATNRITMPFLPGTYLIKAVDLLGNESANATAIITYDPGALANVVYVINEDPDFAGVKVDTAVYNNILQLADPEILYGEYYFDNSLDLQAVYTSFVSVGLVANGSRFNNIFAISDIFAEPDIFGGGDNDIFDMDDIFAVEDIFGIGADAWAVEVQSRITLDDPGDMGAVWSAWEPLIAGNIEFRAIEFRLIMQSYEEGVTPIISKLNVTIDMPDRIERGEDLTVPALGTTISFVPPFLVDPAVVITIQDGDANDEIQFITKDAEEFSFRVYNTTLADYVERTYDYIASGFGRRLS